MAMWPPSRKGIGRALSTARFREMKAMNTKKPDQPDLTASLPPLTMAMGPPTSRRLAWKLTSRPKPWSTWPVRWHGLLGAEQRSPPEVPELQGRCCVEDLGGAEDDAQLALAPIVRGRHLERAGLAVLLDGHGDGLVRRGPGCRPRRPRSWRPGNESSPNWRMRSPGRIPAWAAGMPGSTSQDHQGGGFRRGRGDPGLVHAHGGKQHVGREQVGQDAAGIEQHPPVVGLLEEAVGIFRLGLLGVVARELHVAAQGEGGQPDIGLLPLEARRAGDRSPGRTPPRAGPCAWRRGSAPARAGR